MAKAKIQSLSKQTLYFGKKTDQDTLTVMLDLSEIKGKSDYQYACFVYFGGFGRTEYIQTLSKKTANSELVTWTVHGSGTGFLYFPYNSTTSVAYVEVVTYKNGTEIDSDKKKFSAKIHTDVKPTVGDLTLNPANTANGYNLLLSNFNAFSIKIGYSSWNTKGNAWAPTPGADIVSYTITADTGDGVVSTKITTSKGYYHHKYVSVNLDKITHNPSFTIAMQDSRGLTCEKKVEYTLWRHYTRPIINECTVVRSDPYGNQQDDGRFACITSADVTVKSVYNANGTININADYAVTFQLDGSLVTPYYQTSDRIVFDLGDRKSHCLGIKITDAVGGQSNPYAVYINSVDKIINVLSDGTGIAFGSKAETSEEFYCEWGIQCNGEITANKGVNQGSDKKLKNNIKDINVNILDSLQPVQYELVATKDGKIHYGFIAQDVERLLIKQGLSPEAIGMIGHASHNKQEFYTLAYNEFIPLIVKKCQELQKENNEMRAEIAEIKQLLLQASSE